MLIYTASEFFDNGRHYTIINNMLGIVVVEMTKQWIVKRNTANDRCFMIAWKDVPVNMRVKRLALNA
jgi:hypothetical protein